MVDGAMEYLAVRAGRQQSRRNQQAQQRTKSKPAPEADGALEYLKVQLARQRGETVAKSPEVVFRNPKAPVPDFLRGTRLPDSQVSGPDAGASAQDPGVKTPEAPAPRRDAKAPALDILRGMKLPESQEAVRGQAAPCQGSVEELAPGKSRRTSGQMRRSSLSPEPNNGKLQTPGNFAWSPADSETSKVPGMVSGSLGGSAAIPVTNSGEAAGGPHRLQTPAMGGSVRAPMSGSARAPVSGSARAPVTTSGSFRAPVSPVPGAAGKVSERSPVARTRSPVGTRGSPSPPPNRWPRTESLNYRAPASVGTPASQSRSLQPRSPAAMQESGSFVAQAAKREFEAPAPVPSQQTLAGTPVQTSQTAVTASPFSSSIVPPIPSQNSLRHTIHSCQAGYPSKQPVPTSRQASSQAIGLKTGSFQYTPKPEASQASGLKTGSFQYTPKPVSHSSSSNIATGNDSTKKSSATPETNHGVSAPTLEVENSDANRSPNASPFKVQAFGVDLPQSYALPVPKAPAAGDAGSADGPAKVDSPQRASPSRDSSQCPVPAGQAASASTTHRTSPTLVWQPSNTPAQRGVLPQGPAGAQPVVVKPKSWVPSATQPAAPATPVVRTPRSWVPNPQPTPNNWVSTPQPSLQTVAPSAPVHAGAVPSPQLKATAPISANAWAPAPAAASANHWAPALSKQMPSMLYAASPMGRRM
eukprot:TRINITY_DN6540_c0_g1_i1.p1 TRINITY_DN6540_c0_g1~~TRINITY_DN6540_c0_g1_i1.p1  ORF type:complete len:713 (+),score=94.80 TRINITY_DN6540_c0_g1_i1:46-2139(+)